jgi:hypothetical protein
MQTFPGPPNFDSIKGGDDIERHFYLKLDVPVDVLPTGPHPTVDNPDEELKCKSDGNYPSLKTMHSGLDLGECVEGT